MGGLMNQRDERDGPGQGQKGRLNRRGALALLPVLGSLSLASAAQANPPKSSQDVLELATSAALRNTVVPERVQRVVTRGYEVPGDGGGALWRRSAVQPRHQGYLTDRKGAFFEIDGGVLLPEMFGARGGDEDDLAAIQMAVSAAVHTHRRVEFTRPRYTINGEIIIPGDVERFALIGAGMTDLVQMRDNTSIFFFNGENTRRWRISGFNFLWRRHQDAAQRKSYAVRFESDASRGSGHWNFEISHCYLSNGFRGFGQSDDGDKKIVSPIWGANFSHINAGLSTSGAALHLRTWQRAGQPNIRIEQFYARCDGMSEPAIILEACETSVLASVEFNLGRGCQIRIDTSANTLLHGVRFEQVSLGPDEAYIEASGALTNAVIDGLSLQSMIIVPGGASQRRPGIVRATGGATVVLREFTDRPVRSSKAARDATMTELVSLLDPREGTAVLEHIVPLTDPALTLVEPANSQRVLFANMKTLDFVFSGTGAPVFSPVLVNQKCFLVAVTLSSEGLPPEMLEQFAIIRNGKVMPIGDGVFRLRGAGKRRVVLPRALRADEQSLRLESGDVLQLQAPKASASLSVSTILVSLTAVPG